ncbi:MAG: hypothetical protein E6Q43_02480 [Dokdonella sp.]|nr:MAG: hypothetical protein EYC71_04790 [Gammaproteobacteria bacterium]TXI76204.1 MAG: hypothetical protein E6Q43_02480 [Dokdonella sp.]
MEIGDRKLGIRGVAFLPLPLAGEGWGEGGAAHRCKAFSKPRCHPHPSLRAGLSRQRERQNRIASRISHPESRRTSRHWAQRPWMTCMRELQERTPACLRRGDGV